MSTTEPPLRILGGGPAGMAAAWYACRAGVPATLYEASGEPGGNARTLHHGPFAYDTGAHRLHDKDPAVTRDWRELLGDDLRRVGAPSQVWSGGRGLPFPLRPAGLLRALPPRVLARALLELAARRPGGGPPRSLGELAERNYGPTVAGRFLLNYSRKLWGADPFRLSPAVSGARLRQLGAGELLRQLLPRRGPAPHLEGSFLYPREGIGQLWGAIADQLPAGALRARCPVQRLRHDGSCVRELVAGGEPPVAVDQLLSTLPLPVLVDALDPAPPARVREAAHALPFRDLLLVRLELRQGPLSDNASIYFPDPALPFTRLYEPSNRSAELAPAGRSLVVVEWPVPAGAPTPDAAVEAVVDGLAGCGLLRPAEVVGSGLQRLPRAYPVLTHEALEAGEAVLAYLGRFGNLRLVGRNATFGYLHLHDLFAQAREAVGEIGGGPKPRLRPPGI